MDFVEEASHVAAIPIVIQPSAFVAVVKLTDWVLGVAGSKVQNAIVFVSKLIDNTGAIYADT